MYEDMLAGQVSKEIGHSSALGIGDLLYSKLEPLVKTQAQKAADLAAAKAQSVHVCNCRRKTRGPTEVCRSADCMQYFSKQHEEI